MDDRKTVVFIFEGVVSDHILWDDPTQILGNPVPNSFEAIRNLAVDQKCNVIILSSRLFDWQFINESTNRIAEWFQKHEFPQEIRVLTFDVDEYLEVSNDPDAMPCIWISSVVPPYTTLYGPNCLNPLIESDGSLIFKT